MVTNPTSWSRRPVPKNSLDHSSRLLFRPARRVTLFTPRRRAHTPSPVCDFRAPCGQPSVGSPVINATLLHLSLASHHPARTPKHPTPTRENRATHEQIHLTHSLVTPSEVNFEVTFLHLFHRTTPASPTAAPPARTPPPAPCQTPPHFGSTDPAHCLMIAERNSL